MTTEQESLERRIIAYVSEMFAGGAVVTHAFLHPEDWQDLSFKYESLGRKLRMQNNAGYTFATIDLRIGRHTIFLQADKYIGKDRFLCYCDPSKEPDRHAGALL